MTKTDLLIHSARQLITCSSLNGPKRGLTLQDAGVIEDGALAIDQGRIVAVGSSQALRRQFTASDEIDASGAVVLPGFVDPHTHAVFAGCRVDEFEQRVRGSSYLEILEAGGGILSTTRATRAAARDDLVVVARRRLERMMTLGATTIEVKTGYGLDLATELRMLDVIAELDLQLPVDVVPTFMPAHAVPPEFTGRSGAYVELIINHMMPAAIDWYRKSHFATIQRPFFVDVFCESSAFNLEETKRILEAGKSLGFALRAHIAEFTNLGGVGVAIGLGAVSIDHLDTISAEEMQIIASSNTIAVVTPAVNFNLGAGSFADARGLIDSGAALALTTDFNPGSAPCFSLPLVMAIACRFCHLLPVEALNAVTINAAHAVGMGDQVGSLDVGKQADLLIADVDDFRLLAYELGGNPIKRVFKKGRVIS